MKPYLLLAIATAACACAQESGGQAEVALQGYYLGGASQNLLGTTGVAVKFQQFFPGFGLLRGNLEGYRTGGTIQPADNFIEFRGMVWGGLRWNLTGGDFRVTASPVHNPFNNLFFPEINARGVQIEAGNSTSSYNIFYGNETLLGGPRIPFRVNVPQTAMGAGLRRKFGRLETGVRLLHLTTGERDLRENSPFFPVGHSFLSADSLTAYAAYKFSEHFQWYAEAAGSRVRTIDTPSTVQPMSYFFGPAWESPRLTIRANYANLGGSYLPVAGYSIGNRKGPFGEVRIRPLRRLELFAAASRYETTDRHDTATPEMRSTGTSAGASVELPWKFSLSAQLSTIQFSLFDPKIGAEQNSRNRQLTGTLSRQIGRHTLRFTARDMRLMVSGVPGREKTGEVEDTFQFHHFVFGGGVRAQQSVGTERRNSFYLKGSAQVNLGRLSAYGYFEGGKDLVNQSVFATNAISSSVVSSTLRLTRHWNIQGEAFRSRFIASLNPESLFIQGNQGVIMNPILSRFNQWSFLFRVVRSFNWGSQLPGGDIDQFMKQRIPVVGGVEGFVHVLASGEKRPAPGVSVSLESGRIAKTGADGHYRFDGVPEGAHTVGINLEELPADYNPGEKTKSPVIVSSRRPTRVDLELYALSAFIGRVAVSPGAVFESLEGIVIRLDPGQRYTTTLKDGSFAFYNTPDGDYQVCLEEKSLSSETRLKSAPTAPLAIRTGGPPPVVEFEIDRRPVQEKRIRKVLDQRIPSALLAPRPEASKPAARPEPAQAPIVLDTPAPVTAIPVSSDASARNTRGRELIKQRKYREAIQELNAAVSQQPDFALAFNARGFAYYLLRDYKHALADFDSAIRLNPKYRNAYENRSQARKALGDLPGAASDALRSRELR